jgi:hypothetical protein
MRVAQYKDARLICYLMMVIVSVVIGMYEYTTDWDYELHSWDYVPMYHLPAKCNLECSPSCIPADWERDDIRRRYILSTSQPLRD